MKYRLPVAKSCLPALCFQWPGAALRRWRGKRSTRLSMWRSAVSTDRRPRSLYQGVWGYGAGLAASRCPFSVGWGLVRASSSSRGRWGLARRGWAVPRATKTSCGFIMRRSSRGPTLVMWTLTECVTCPCLETGQVLSGWGGELNEVFMLRREGDRQTGPMTLSSPVLWLFGDKEWSFWILQHARWTQSNMTQRGMCLDCLFSQTRNSQVFKCSKIPFGFLCV